MRHSVDSLRLVKIFVGNMVMLKKRSGRSRSGQWFNVANETDWAILMVKFNAKEVTDRKEYDWTGNCR